MRGTPEFGTDLISDDHRCLLLRFPGSTEFRRRLNRPDGPQNFQIAGPFSSDDGDVLTAWALDGRGIVNKPVFEVADHLASGALVQVCTESPPVDAQLACLFQHKRYQDPKVRLFIDFMADEIKIALHERDAVFQLRR